MCICVCIEKIGNGLFFLLKVEIWLPACRAFPGDIQIESRSGLCLITHVCSQVYSGSLASCMMEGYLWAVPVTWVQNRNIFLSFPTSDNAQSFMDICNVMIGCFKILHKNGKRIRKKLVILQHFWMEYLITLNDCTSL